MTPEYKRKLQSALITTGKQVIAKINDRVPTVLQLEVLFDKLLQAIDKEDMKGQGQASKELMANLLKYQIENL